MANPVYRAAVFALYQVALVVGIALLPLALAVRQVGVELPLGRLVGRLGDAYADAR
jgi:hypothetical protein